jgi:hypothetical protein
LRFYAELGDLLARDRRGREFEHEYAAGGSVKDLIESLGIPHTEVDLVLVNGLSVDFAYHVGEGDRVSVYPVFEALDISPVVSLRPKPLRMTRFAADVHLGRLAGYLRLCGFDTLYRTDWGDDHLAETAVEERRILLTRDRRLLMRSIVTHGCLVRATLPRDQLREVLDRLDLRGSLEPLTRCSVCNGLVESVTKAEVAAGLPPRTAEHYGEFWRCAGCGHVYWKGAHYRSLSALFSAGGLISGRE